MLAAAFLAIATAAERCRDSPPDGQILLTRNEIATLFAHLTIKPPAGTAHRLDWSTWRRRHQYRARQCHYRPKPMKITIYGWSTRRAGRRHPAAGTRRTGW
jgi:hypothetical protein